MDLKSAGQGHLEHASSYRIPAVGANPYTNANLGDDDWGSRGRVVIEKIAGR